MIGVGVESTAQHQQQQTVKSAHWAPFQHWIRIQHAFCARLVHFKKINAVVHVLGV